MGAVACLHPILRVAMTWDGWHCTRCSTYHGYGAVFTQDNNVLCSRCKLEYRWFMWFIFSVGVWP